MVNDCAPWPTSPDEAYYSGLKHGRCWTVLVPRQDMVGNPAPCTRERALALLADFRRMTPEASLAILTKHDVMDGSYWTWEPITDA